MYLVDEKAEECFENCRYRVNAHNTSAELVQIRICGVEVQPRRSAQRWRQRLRPLSRARPPICAT